MASSYTTRNRILKQGTGENLNSWGDLQSSGDFDMIDAAMDGLTVKAVTGDVTLTTALATPDEARSRGLKFTGSATATVTLPAVEKWYWCWNAGTGTITVASSGGGSTVALGPGDLRLLFCDATHVKQQLFGGVDLKTYVDNVAWTYNAGALPAQAGSADKFLATDGTTAGWRTLGATTTEVRTGSATAVACTPANLTAAQAVSTLTDAATISWAVATQGLNARVVLGGNRLIDNPTGLQDGDFLSLAIAQDATGSRVPSWGSKWDFGSVGLPTLQTSASKQDLVTGQYRAATDKIYASFMRGA